MDLRALYGPVTIAESAIIGENCTLGFPKEARVQAERRVAGSVGRGAAVSVGERCLLFNQVTLYEGVRVAEDCVIEDRVRIGYDSTVGPRTRIAYGAYVCDRVSIGADAIVAGFVCDGATIGDRSTVMGQLVHEYTRPHRGWWEVDEEPPRIDADTVVGYGSCVVGGVCVGPRAYVAAGAIVTRDVTPGHVATGVNILTPISEWPGERLQELIRHWTTEGA